MKTFLCFILIFSSVCVWAQNAELMLQDKSKSDWINSLKGDPAILIPLARTNADPQVRALALNALTFNADKSVTLAMIEALKDKSPLVRKAAVFGLGLTERGMIPEEVAPLAKCLQDKDAEICLQAAGILYSYPGGSEAAMPELKKMLKSRDADLRNAATDALKNYNPQKTSANQRTNNTSGAKDILEMPSAGQKPAASPMAPRDVLGIFIHDLAVTYSEEHGKKWTATIKVVDEAGKSVSGANVSVTYYIPPKPDQDPWSSWQKIEGVTDSNGVLVVSHKDSSLELGFHAQKTGYYSTTEEHEFIKFKDDDPSKWNPIVTLVLKKKIHPIPMYVNRVDIAHRVKPALDKPIGFDLTVGDFVAPYGKGTNAQIYFTWHNEYDTNNDLSTTYESRRRYGWYDTMTISFPNPGDGIQEFDRPGILNDRLSEGNVGSELRSPQLAPADDYQSQLVKVSSWHFGKLGNTNNYDELHKNYFLRVNTILDEKGNVKSAQYGKIYGDFDQAITTYLNPEPNSREIEYDMQHNLGRSGNNFYITP